ncbi:MAG TPA: TonB-dependent receptor [Polyangia bacterium]|nr:TonB-dependent receptor [Polyangia bacterium]
MGVVLVLVSATPWSARADEDGGAPSDSTPADESATPVADERVEPAPVTASDAQSIVTATRVAPNAAREDVAAASSVRLPAESPRARDDLGALLLEVPGANVTRRGGLGAFATVSLRGSNPDEVRIYIDGVPLNQAVGGAVDLSTLPLGDVERVEVYRGSTPMRFGESSLGGVVSIATQTPGGTPRASLRAGAGSFRTTFADGTVGGGAGPLRFYAGLHVLHAQGDFPDAPPAVAGGFQPPTRQNDDLSQVDGVLRATLALPGRRELRFGWLAIWRDQGLPARNIFRSDARAASARGLAHLDYESRDDLGASGRLRAQIYASGTRDEFHDPLHQIAGLPVDTRDLTGTAGTTVNLDKALGDRFHLAVMLAGRGETFLPHNDLDPASPMGHAATRTVGSAGAELDALIAPANLHVIPSARVELSRDVRTGRDLVLGEQLPAAPPVEHALPALRLGLLRPLGATAALRANVGRYARIPSFTELYGYNRGILGNPTLRPERGVNVDVGASVDRGGVSAALTVFGARATDLIAWQTFTNSTRAENIARTRVWGVEAELRARWRRLALITQGTLTDARDGSDVAANRGRQIAHHPRYRGYGRAEWRQPVVAGSWTISGYADLDATAGDHWTTTANTTPARLLVGAGAAVEHARSGLRLVASGLDLGDSRVEDFPGYPLPGRSVFVSLGWSHATTSAPIN